MTPDLYTNLFFNVALGFVIGGYGTLVGAGGGFLLVPLFLLVHKLPHEVAVGTSLAIVAANAASGAAGYVWQRKVDLRAGTTFALATLPGAVAGVYLTEVFSGPAFMRVFGVLLCCISLYLFFRRPVSDPTSAPRRGRWYVQRQTAGEAYSYHEPLGLSISAVVGAISSWLGIGGGIVHVPAMTEILRFPVHVAVATSHFILAFTALFGAISHGMAGHLNFRLALSAGLGAVAGAQLGVRLAPRVRGGVVLRFLSLALFLVGLRLLF